MCYNVNKICTHFQTTKKPPWKWELAKKIVKLFMFTNDGKKTSQQQQMPIKYVYFHADSGWIMIENWLVAKPHRQQTLMKTGMYNFAHRFFLSLLVFVRFFFLFSEMKYYTNLLKIPFFRRFLCTSKCYILHTNTYYFTCARNKKKL